MPTESLPPGDGTPCGYGDPYGTAYATAGTGYGYAYTAGASQWSGSWGGDAPKPIRPRPNRRTLAAIPGPGYDSRSAMAISADWDEQLGQNASLLYRRMLLDPQVKSSWSYLKFAVLGDGPKFTPAITPTPGVELTPEEEAEEALAADIADYCRRQHDRAGSKSLAQMLDAMVRRSACAEVVEGYAEDGPDAGRVVIGPVEPLPADAWGFWVDRATGAATAIAGWSDGRPVAIGLDSVFLLTWEAEPGDPRGTSILTAAYSAWNEKVSLVPERFRHMVLFGSPSVVYELPPEAQARHQRDQHGFEDFDAPLIPPETEGLYSLSAFRNGGMMVHGSGGKVTIVGGQNDGGAFSATIDACNREIATAILINPRATMEAEHGSKADSEGGQDASGKLIRYAQGWLGNAYRGVFKRLVAKNWGPDVAERLTPTVSFGVEHQDRAKLLEMYTKAGYTLAPGHFEQVDVDLGLHPTPRVIESKAARDEPPDDTPPGDEEDEDDKGDKPAAFADRAPKPDPITDADLKAGRAFLAWVADKQSIDPANLTPESSRLLLEAIASRTSEVMRADADALLASLAPAEFAAFGPASAIGRFFKRAAKTLRVAYLAAVLAVVGPGGMDADAREAAGIEMARQGAYLKAFEKAVRDGSQGPEGIAARAAMYGQATWGVGQNVGRAEAIAGGLKEERRILDPAEAHCPECPPLAEMGWQEIGTLPAIGQTVCRVNCRCHWEFQ